jgi:hypothetical protein
MVNPEINIDAVAIGIGIIVAVFGYGALYQNVSQLRSEMREIKSLVYTYIIPHNKRRTDDV